MIFHSVLCMIRQFTIYWYKHIFQKRVDISWSLFLFVIFLSEYRSNNSVKRQPATVFVWADENEKKNIIHTSYSPASSSSLCNGFYNVFRKIWQFDFFLYFKCVNIWTKSTHFQKENPLFVLLITLFSNRYCLMSCQYAGNVLILQTVF